VLGAPFGTVEEQHVGTLGPRHLDTREPLLDEVDGIVDVAFEDLAQLIDPLVALRSVCADQRVHGQHVHAVVVREGGLLCDSVAQVGVVDDAI